VINNPVVETTPTRLPGACAGCGATQLSAGRDWFLDTDVDYLDTPSYAIQICNICFDLLANICGYIKKGEEVAQYKRKIAKLEAEINELTKYHNLVDLLGIDSGRIDTLTSIMQEHVAKDTLHLVELSAEVGSGEGEDLRQVGSGTEGLSESLDDERVAELRPSKSAKSVRVNI
jgi:hypothetical protein